MKQSWVILTAKGYSIPNVDLFFCLLLTESRKLKFWEFVFVSKRKAEVVPKSHKGFYDHFITTCSLFTLGLWFGIYQGIGQYVDETEYFVGQKTSFLGLIGNDVTKVNAQNKQTKL